MTALRIYKHFCLVLEAEKISSEKWQKMVKNWSKWSKLPDFDGLRTGFFFHPQRKLNLFWYHQYYSEYESGSQSKAQNLLPPYQYEDSYLVSNICNKTSHQHICNIHHADCLEATSTPTQY